MDHIPDLDAVADAMITAYAVIDKHGTPEMKALSRMLLISIGKALSQRVGHLDDAAGPRVDATDPLQTILEERERS